MPKTKSVEYVVDEKGRRKSVIMSYRAYLELMEDLNDLASIAERRNEPSEDLESIIADLKNARKIQS